MLQSAEPRNPARLERLPIRLFRAERAGQPAVCNAAPGGLPQINRRRSHRKCRQPHPPHLRCITDSFTAPPLPFTPEVEEVEFRAPPLPLAQKLGRLSEADVLGLHIEGPPSKKSTSSTSCCTAALSPSRRPGVRPAVHRDTARRPIVVASTAVGDARTNGRASGELAPENRIPCWVVEFRQGERK